MTGSVRDLVIPGGGATEVFTDLDVAEATSTAVCALDLALDALDARD